MARQLDNEPFRCYSNASAEIRFDSRESMRHGHIANTPQPPSWADVEVNVNMNTQRFGHQQQWNVPQNHWNAPQHPRYQYQRQQPQPWIQQSQKPADNDVFSAMDYWGGNPNAMAMQTGYQKPQQYGRYGHFNEPNPLPPSGDVFNNVGTWNPNTIIKKAPSPIETMTIDLMAKTPSPTFQPYPVKSHSLASPTTSSLTSSELPETNSWACLALLLDGEPSPSPSLASSGTKSPTENTNGHWISNLQ